jgi:hypothetical protein
MDAAANAIGRNVKGMEISGRGRPTGAGPR